MKNKRRLLEMSGIIHRSEILVEQDDLFGDEEDPDLSFNAATIPTQSGFRQVVRKLTRVDRWPRRIGSQ